MIAFGNAPVETPAAAHEKITGAAKTPAAANAFNEYLKSRGIDPKAFAEHGGLPAGQPPASAGEGAAAGTPQDAVGQLKGLDPADQATPADLPADGDAVGAEVFHRHGGRPGHRKDQRPRPAQASHLSSQTDRRLGEGPRAGSQGRPGALLGHSRSFHPRECASGGILARDSRQARRTCDQARRTQEPESGHQSAGSTWPVKRATAAERQDLSSRGWSERNPRNQDRAAYAA